MSSFRKRPVILTEDDHDPYLVINPQCSLCALITCDHASNNIPSSLNLLGLTKQQLGLHIAYDIGCEQVSHQISKLLNAPLIMGRYSRLVIDLNRHLDDPTSIAKISDGHQIPGNQVLSRQAVQQRIEEIFIPYHSFLTSLLEQKCSLDQTPVIIAIHSFTPVYKGFVRPWHYGILWDRDDRLAAPLIDRLSQKPNLCIGENKPYHAREPIGYTMDVHGEEKGYANALIEIRQDLIETAAGQKRVAQELAQVLRTIMADASICRTLKVKQQPAGCP